MLTKLLGPVAVIELRVLTLQAAAELLPQHRIDIAVAPVKRSMQALVHYFELLDDHAGATLVH